MSLHTLDCRSRIVLPLQIAEIKKHVSELTTTIVMIAQPHSSSGIHHHSTQDTIIYAVKGHGAVISEGGKTKQALGPGDWALIPAGVEHQEVNEGDEEVIWAITRGGKTAAVENVNGWSS